MLRDERQEQDKVPDSGPRRSTVKRGSLDERAKRIKKGLSNMSNGPLVIAKDVVDLIDNWEAYRQEAGDIDATAWLYKVSGYHAKWYQDRHRAVSLLDESARRSLHHEVAVWVVNKLSKEDLPRAMDLLTQGYRQNNNIPLTRPRAYRILAEEFEFTKQTKTCKRCQRLEALLAEHGIEVE